MTGDRQDVLYNDGELYPGTSQSTLPFNDPTLKRAATASFTSLRAVLLSQTELVRRMKPGLLHHCHSRLILAFSFCNNTGNYSINRQMAGINVCGKDRNL